jgi:chitodextrinase
MRAMVGAAPAKAPLSDAPLFASERSCTPTRGASFPRLARLWSRTLLVFPARSTRLLGVAATAAVAALVVGSASASTGSKVDAAKLPTPLPRLWAVQVSTSKHGWFDRTLLQQTRKQGINALVLDTSAMGTTKAGATAFESVRSFAARQKMHLIAVVSAGKPRSPAAARALSDCAASPSSWLRCALRARSLTAAKQLARKRDRVRQLVAVYVSGPGMISGVSTLPSTLPRPILVVAPLYSRFNGSVWSTAIGQTAAMPSANMAVAPQLQRSSSAVQQFAKMLAAAGSAASTPGADVTAPSAPAATVNGVTPYTVTVSWAPSVDDVNVAGYGLYLNGVLQQPAAVSPVTLQGLTCGLVYTVGLDAYDAAGNHSARTNVTTAPGPCGGGGGSSDTSSPSTPVGLVATPGQTSVTLSWAASTDNTGVGGYPLYLDGAQVGTTALTTYTFTGLACGVSHTFGVAAYDAAGNASGIAGIGAKTLACSDSTPPTTPTALSPSGIGQTGITVSWTASTDNVGVTGYRVLLGGSLVTTVTGTAYTLGGLSCGTSYTVGVAAYDAACNVSPTATVQQATLACSGDSTPPSTPTGLARSGVSQTSATLSWTASTDNVGVTGYRLYRNGAQVGTSTTTSFVFSGLSCGTSYTLGVAAYDAAGNLSAVAAATQLTSACSDATPPSTPTGLATSAVTQTAITLSWTASTDNVGVAGYRVFRNGTQVATASATSHTFSGLSCGTSYTLGVAAYDAAGNVSGTAAVTRSTSACSSDTQAPSTPSGLATGSVGQSSVSVSWNASTDNVGVTGYRLFLNGTQAGTSATTSYAFSGLSCGTSYTLGVAAYDAAGNVSATATVSAATTACGGPPPNRQVVMGDDIGWALASSIPWNDLTEISLFALQTTNGTALDTSLMPGVNVPAWTGAARAHGVESFIQVGGIDNQDWEVACNNTNRAGFVANLVNYAVSNGFDGIDLDIEDNLWSSQNPPVAAMTTCIQAVATAAHATLSQVGKPLRVIEEITTPWMGSWIAPSQNYLDEIHLMTFGYTTNAQFLSDVQATIGEGVTQSAKFVLGIDDIDYADNPAMCGRTAAYAKQQGWAGTELWSLGSDTNYGCLAQLAANS